MEELLQDETFARLIYHLFLYKNLSGSVVVVSNTPELCVLILVRLGYEHLIALIILQLLMELKLARCVLTSSGLHFECLIEASDYNGSSELEDGR